MKRTPYDTNSYVLRGVTKDSIRGSFPVRMAGNQSAGQLKEIAAFFAMNTKKEPGALSRRTARFPWTFLLAPP